MAISDEEYAILSNAVYRDGDFISPENYEFVKLKELEISDEGDFYAEAYERNKEVVIAYRGSATWQNYIHDLDMWASDIKPPEFKKAMQFYNKVKQYCNTKSLSLVGMTGHSLGGSMVQYVNATLATEKGYQIQGVAFAPAGIGKFFKGLDPSSISVKNYIRDGDMVPGWMYNQLGNPEWTEYLSGKHQSYSVKYSDGVGEVLSSPGSGKLAQHAMLGYLVDVAHLQTRPARNAVDEYCYEVDNVMEDNYIWPGNGVDEVIVAQMLKQGYSQGDIIYALKTCSPGHPEEKDIVQYIERAVNGYATGGHLESGQVSGPGTGTSDSILAWLGNKGKFIRISNGEYVIRANAVQKWGTNFLDSINNGIIPEELYNGKSSYATGGSISNDSVNNPQGNLGEALWNVALTLLQSIQKYAQEMIKKIMSGLGLDMTALQSSAPGTLASASGGQKERGQADQNVLLSKENGPSAILQSAAYNRELTKTPSLLDKIHEASKKTFEAGLSNFLTEGIIKSKNLGEAFRNLAISVLQSIQKIYAEAVSKNIMSMLGLGAKTPETPSSTASVLGTTDSSGFYYDPNFGIKLAEGGHIQGPGSGTSDSIPSWLSHGEFVIKASSVQKYGTNLLHSLNNGFIPKNLMPRFATGGLIGASVEGATAITSNLQSGDVTVPLKIVNVTDPNEVGRYLKTRSGERIMVNFMKNNAGTMRQILNVKG